MSSNTRLSWLDIAKGICILLVVLGHSGVHWYDNVMSWFRMPLFFFLSGILFRPIPSSSFPNFMSYKLIKMLVPYFAYGIAITLIFYINSPTQMYINFQRLLVGGDQLEGPFGVFWFITVLLMTQLTMGFISRYSKITQISIIILLFILTHIIALTHLSNISMPWKINAVGGSLFYYAMGYYLKDFLKHNVANLKVIGSSLFFLAMFLLIYVIFDINFAINLKTDNFSYIILDAIIPIVCCYLICCLAYYLSYFRVFDVLKWLGKNSITIMYLHLPLNILLMKLWKPEYSDFIFLMNGVVISLIIGILLKQSKIVRNMFISPHITKQH
ncbi:acyltransferase family protein [Staphylococcus sp. 11261D007BR]